jgi:hypothetical protein
MKYSLDGLYYTTSTVRCDHVLVSKWIAPKHGKGNKGIRLAHCGSSLMQCRCTHL